MKKAMLLLSISAGLFSCADTHNVRLLSTGGVVKAIDIQDRDFKTGDTVCVSPERYTYNNEWRVCEDGSMKDTLYSFSYTRPDSTYGITIIEHAKGIIK